MAISFLVSAEDVVVNRVRSRLATLDNYRRTSMVAHGGLHPSVRLYAASVGTEIHGLADDHPEFPELQRWVRKFDDYVQQHGLVETGV